MKRYASYKPSGVPWLGDVPAHWISAKLKFRLDRNDGGAWGDEPQGENDTLVLRSTEQTVDGRWKIEDPAYRKLSPTEVKDTLLIEGDLLVTKSSGSETHIGKTSLVNADIAGLRAGYSNFMQRLRVVDDVIPKYVWYLLNSDTTKTQVNILASTTTGLANLNAGVLGRLVLAYPPPEEQQAIADYLDAETTRIDTLIHEKDELIGLLKEWRQSMIAEVVTKGLDKTVTMKPSGVPWLGDVPAHWNIVAMGKRIEDCFNGTTSEQFPESNKLSMVTRIETISEGFVNYEYVGYVEHTEHLNRYQLKAGDILFSHINSLAMVGNCARYLGERPLYLGMNLLCLRPGSLIRSDYLYWTIRSFGFRKSVEKMAKPAINQASIPMSSLKRLMLVSPPLVEQQAIADYLDTETAKIDALIAHAKDDIVLLKELRSATIADAVLGRIDVRTH